MKVGMIGLGRMGGNMARRLARHGIPVCGFAPDAHERPELAREKDVDVTNRLHAMIAALERPRVIWMMVPAGAPTEENVQTLAQTLEPGDILVDGGNAHYRDSQRRARLLTERNIGFLDVGVSGGIWGFENGYGLMIGGAREHFRTILPLIQALAPAPDRGWVYCGPSGAGHFTKMIHNGIEYGLMQAYAEGFSIMAAHKDLNLPLGDIAAAWCHGTVIRSWLLELTAGVLRDAGSLGAVAPEIADSGEGRWTAQEAIELGVPAPVISGALMTRFSSQGHGDFGARLLAKLRNAFGGHQLPGSEDPSPHPSPR
jgi:6-phosphogluconate dehydrogenase